MGNTSQKISNLPLAFTTSGGSSVSARYTLEKDAGIAAQPEHRARKMTAEAPSDRPAAAKASEEKIREHPDKPQPKAAQPNRNAIKTPEGLQAAILKAAGTHLDGNLQFMADLVACHPSEVWAVQANYLHRQTLLFCEHTGNFMLAAESILKEAWPKK
jgi:hypothetical protein